MNKTELRLLEITAEKLGSSKRNSVKPKSMFSTKNRLKKKTNKYVGKLATHDNADSPLALPKSKSPFTKLSDSKPLEKKKGLKETKKKIKLEDSPTTQESLNKLLKVVERHMQSPNTRPEHKAKFIGMRSNIRNMIPNYPTEESFDAAKTKY